MVQLKESAHKQSGTAADEIVVTDYVCACGERSVFDGNGSETCSRCLTGEHLQPRETRYLRDRAVERRQRVQAPPASGVSL